MTRGKHRLLLVFAWHELVRFSTLLDGTVPFEGLVEVIVDNQTHRHDSFVIDLRNHVDQLGLQLSQCAEQVIKGLTALAWCRLVNDLICKVDVALNQVHVVDELDKLSRNTALVLALLRWLS